MSTVDIRLAAGETAEQSSRPSSRLFPPYQTIGSIDSQLLHHHLPRRYHGDTTT